MNGATAPGGFLTAYVSEHSEDLFFNNHDELKKYLNASQNDGENNKCCGKNYFDAITLFIREHFAIGEKYLEYLKSTCDGIMCYCKDLSWIGPQCEKVPKPYPDYDIHGFHYKHVYNTSNLHNGVERVIDDYQPRKQLIEYINKNGFPDEEAITEFSQKYIVDESLVVKHLDHLRYYLLI